MNQQGFQSLEKPIYNPVARLGVGEAEVKHNVTGGVIYPHLPKEALVPEMYSNSSGLAGFDTEDQVKEDEYTSTYYIGDAIGGF
jgi:hypothetical protein